MNGYSRTAHERAGRLSAVNDAGACLLLALLIMATGTAMAQEAVWELRRLDVEGTTEAGACRDASAAAADEARAHLGLNMKACTCRQVAGDAEDNAYACRLDFEVLVRR